jgi:hypothetical protein
MKRSSLVICCFVARAVFAQTTTFQDKDFATGWTTTTLTGTVPATATATGAQVLTGGTGSTAPFRQVQHTGYNVIFAAHVHQPSTYDPATGEIVSIDYSYDLLGISLPPGQAVAYRLLLLQNGSYYTAPNDQVITNTWTTIPV